MFTGLLVVVMILGTYTYLYPATLEEIERIVVNTKIDGYKFVSKVSDKAWKIRYKLSDDENEFFVEVGPNNNNPDLDIVYVFSFLKEYRNITSDDWDELVYFLGINTTSLEKGFFSLYKDSNKWYLLYNFTFRRSNFDADKFVSSLFLHSVLLSVYKDVIRNRKYK